MGKSIIRARWEHCEGQGGGGGLSTQHSNKPPTPHSCLGGSGAASVSTTIAERKWQVLGGSRRRGAGSGKRRESTAKEWRNRIQEEKEKAEK